MNNEITAAYLNKFRDRLFALLCEREEKGEWESFLDTLLIELEGFPEEMKSINYVMLCNKMRTLRILRYDLFRKTIFECMGLLVK